MSAPSGRVRVLARVRPAREDEGDPGIRCEGNAVAAEAGGGRAQSRQFAYDGVLGPEATQGDLFDTAGAALIEDVMAGFNGCLLAYGQTGSGKTHSLLAPAADSEKPESAGVVPRALRELFRRISESGEQFEVKFAAVQIYNEHVSDLLADPSDADDQRLTIVRGQIQHVTWVPCAAPAEICSALSRARRSLVYAETKLNKASSRSHAVFRVAVAKTATQSTPGTLGLLTLVDLAGSERIKRSGVAGAHLKEATAINGSLLALGKVVRALATGARAHVPYRDSKLTQLLEGSVGGNSRCTMLVCVSPAADSLGESIAALEFASRAMRVKCTPTVNMGGFGADWEIRLSLQQQAASQAAEQALAAQAAAEAQLDELRDEARQAREAAAAVKLEREAMAELASDAAKQAKRASEALAAAAAERAAAEEQSQQALEGLRAELAAQGEEAERRIQEVQAEVEARVAALGEAEAKFEEASARAQAAGEHCEQVHAELEEERRAKQAVQEQLLDVANKLAQAEQASASLKASCEGLEARSVDLQDQLRGKDELVARQREEAEALQADLDRAMEACEGVTLALASTERKLEEGKARLAAEKCVNAATVAALRNEATAMAAEHGAAIEEVFRASEERVTAVQDQARRLDEALQEATQAKSAVQQALSDSEAGKAAALEEVREAKQALKKLQADSAAKIQAVKTKALADARTAASELAAAHRAELAAEQEQAQQREIRLSAAFKAARKVAEDRYRTALAELTELRKIPRGAQIAEIQAQAAQDRLEAQRAREEAEELRKELRCRDENDVIFGVVKQNDAKPALPGHKCGEPFPFRARHRRALAQSQVD